MRNSDATGRALDVDVDFKKAPLRVRAPCDLAKNT
jgi:hypothetical protein